MNIFFDCEFTGLHQQTTLVSIGCCSATGHKFYAEMDDPILAQTTDWIKENVISKLWKQNPEQIVPDGVTYVVGNTAEVAIELARWLAQWDRVTMWSDVLAYDWVLFCELFGGAFGIPRNVHYIPLDLATMLNTHGVDPDVDREKFAFGEVYAEMLRKKHNALWDAEVIMACWRKLMGNVSNSQDTYTFRPERFVDRNKLEKIRARYEESLDSIIVPLSERATVCPRCERGHFWKISEGGYVCECGLVVEKQGALDPASSAILAAQGAENHLLSEPQKEEKSE